MICPNCQLTWDKFPSDLGYGLISCFLTTSTHERIHGNVRTHTSINLHEVMPHYVRAQREFRDVCLPFRRRRVSRAFRGCRLLVVYLRVFILPTYIRSWPQGTFRTFVSFALRRKNPSLSLFEWRMGWKRKRRSVYWYWVQVRLRLTSRSESAFFIVYIRFHFHAHLSCPCPCSLPNRVLTPFF